MRTGPIRIAGVCVAGALLLAANLLAADAADDPEGGAAGEPAEEESLEPGEVGGLLGVFWPGKGEEPGEPPAPGMELTGEREPETEEKTAAGDAAREPDGGETASPEGSGAETVDAAVPEEREAVSAPEVGEAPSEGAEPMEEPLAGEPPSEDPEAPGERAGETEVPGEEHGEVDEATAGAPEEVPVEDAGAPGEELGGIDEATAGAPEIPPAEPSVPVLGEERDTAAEPPRPFAEPGASPSRGERPAGSPEEISGRERAAVPDAPALVRREPVAAPTPDLEADLRASRRPAPPAPIDPDSIQLPTEEIYGEIEKPDIFFLLPKARSKSDEQLIRSRIRREITRPLIKDWLEEELLLE